MVEILQHFDKFLCFSPLRARSKSVSRVTSVPLTWWRAERFAVVQEGGVLLALTVKALPASVFKWPPHVTLSGCHFHRFSPSIC